MNVGLILLRDDCTSLVALLSHAPDAERAEQYRALLDQRLNELMIARAEIEASRRPA